MALTRVTKTVISDDAIDADKLADGSIITRHIADGAISMAKLDSATNIDTLSASINVQITATNANADAIETRRVSNDTTGENSGASVEVRRVQNIGGAISTVVVSKLTADRAVISDSSGNFSVSPVTSAELAFLDGVSSAIQTQLDAKQPTITGSASTIDTESLTADRAVIVNGSQKIAVSDVTSTELGYLDGVTSAIQTQLDAKQATITGAATTIDDADLTADRAVISSGSGKVAVSAVTATELGYLDGVSSAIQTQLDAKQATITGAATTIDDADLTADRAVISSGSGKVAISAVTATEVGYLDGVTGAIQTQIDAKAALAGATFTGQVNLDDDLIVAGNLVVLGNTALTTQSNNLVVDDAIVMLANNKTGTPAGDIGFLFNRGNQGNAAFFYDESATTFKLSDTKDPESNTSLSPITASNLDVGILTSASLVSTAITQNGATLNDLISSNVDGAISTVNDTNLTTDRAIISSGSGKIVVSDVTATELGYLDGVTSAIQTQFTGAETRRTNNIAGAVSTITTSDLTASRALVSSGSGKVAVSAVTATEIGYLDGVTSAIQTQIDGLTSNSEAQNTELDGVEARRTANIAGAISSVLTSDLTASRAVVSGSGGKIEVSAVTSTEIGHLDGVTSAIQTQINDLETRRNANVLVAAANDFVTFTRLNANLNVVQNNVAALTGGGILLSPHHNVNTSTSTSNVFFIGKNITALNNVISVMIDGVQQVRDVPGTSNNDFIFHNANNTIQLTEASIPAGLTVQTFTLFS